MRGPDAIPGGEAEDDTQDESEAKGADGALLGARGDPAEGARDDEADEGARP